MMVDTTGDGRKDHVLVDTTRDGKVDTLVPIAGNPDLEICETPMKDWVKWDSNASVSVYARRISRAGWGGGIEMAACSRMKKVREAKRAREQAREWKGRGFLVLPSSAVFCFPPLSLWDVP